MKHKTQLIVLSIIGINTISLVGVITYSWLISNRTINDDASGIVVKKPLTVTPYYYSTDTINYTPSSYNYNESGNITTANIFNTNFHSFNSAITLSDFTPLETMTFAFVLTDGGSNTVSLLLDKVTTPTNNIVTAYTDSTVTTEKKVSLFDALEFHFYAKNYDATTIDADSLAFIQESSSISANITKTNMTTFMSNYTLTNTTYNLNSNGNNLYTFPLEGGSKLVFMSIIFSNDSTTYFTKNSNNKYYLDPSGNSNIYKNLSLVLPSFIFSF